MASLKKVEALYIPKSISYTKEGEEYHIKVKADTLLSASVTFICILLAIFVTPIVFGFSAIGSEEGQWGNKVPTFSFLSGLFGALIFLGVIFVIRYFVRSEMIPIMIISKEGVYFPGVKTKQYQIEDIQGFREGADDSWIAQVLTFAKLEFLGIQYGIYSVRTPYLFSKVESLKVAPFLTEILKSVSEEVGEERERKIQQSQVF